MDGGAGGCELVWDYGSGRIDPDVGGFEGHPDLTPRLDLQLADGSGCDLCHQRDLTLDADPNPAAQQLDDADAPRPRVAGAAFGTMMMQRHGTRVDDGEDVTRLGGRSRYHRLARRAHVPVVRLPPQQ